MQLNKVLKGLLIAIPVLALTACGSTSSTSAGGDDSSGVQTTNGANTANTTNNPDVGTVTKAETYEEKQQREDAKLRQTQTVYFDYDKNNVQAKYNDMLSAHARFLVKNPSVKITIEGHCDERGTPEYNIALGERRAKSVAKYLTTLGVQQSQINVVSYGEEKPANKSRTQAGFAENRRAILVY